MDPIVELLQALAPAVPREMTVVALCDRGLASPKLWRQGLAQSLPPATTGGLASPHEVSEKRHFLRRGRPAAALPRLRSHPDTACTGSGTAFGAAAAKRRCTLPAAWYAQQGEPWTILTGLPPDEVGVSWYALRFWTELGFRACPRQRPGGGQEPGLAMAKDPRAGTAARPGLSTPPAPGAGPLPNCHSTAAASRNRTGRMSG